MEDVINDEPEEGEIVDDFEDVSDCSMSPASPFNAGKCVSPELLSAVSLNSVNMGKYGSSKYLRGDTHLFYTQPVASVCRRKRKFSTRLTMKRVRTIKRRKKPLPDHSESDNEAVDPKYAKQLREALGRDSKDLLHNSLRTRLKGFIEPISQSDEELELRDIALLSSNKSPSTDNEQTESVTVEEGPGVKKVEDSELQELRIAALRSFVLENHNKRKLKKQLDNCNNAVKEDANEVNKENDQGVINNDKADEEVIEEDVDNLRALVLASMSNKLIEKSAKTNSVLNVDNEQTKTNFDKRLSSNVTKTIKNDLYFCNNKAKINNLRGNLPNNIVVKPLIIRVNNDSDSELEIDKSSDDLKETAEVDKSNNDIKATVTQFLKKQRAQVEAKATKNSQLNENNVDYLLDKSVVKLLPKSKQIEYRRLKLQLLNATRKNPRIRKLSLTKREIATNNSNSSLKKVPKPTKNDVLVNNAISRLKIPQEKKENPSNQFHQALSGLQVRKNGRLQMKGKYRSLGPLLNKINRTNYERTLHEKEIKTLLLQIQQARNKLATSHQNFIDYIQELVNKKNIIDQRPVDLVKARISPATSTPIKVNETPTQVVSINRQQVVQDKLKECVVDKDEVVLDPNDICHTFTKAPLGTESFPKYTSPLDNRYHISDPHTMMCPYDLLGVCKDNECAYLHCS